ncbi:transcription factor bHLH68-like isoform X1 [Lycium barbarum]|uniref:transcription factor bHLH68-like isoform X1 n=1 Tax=Lycium barbarum TaxID=112863 RepID=UPI00293ED80C|nr:transcription factor bHLH68-like isoform X1 [Lycium barbarum]
MMAGNPSNNWWNIMMSGSMHPHESHEHHQLSSSSSSSLTQHFYGSSSFLADNPRQDFPRSWSQLLLAGLSGDQEKSSMSHFHHQYKKLDNWEEIQNLNSIHNNNIPCSSFRVPVVDVKPEVGQLLYGNYQDLPATSSPASSCVTTNLRHDNFNFSAGNKITSNKVAAKHQRQDHPSECNSTSSGGMTKKARVQHSSAQPSLKVRKEKLGDRITALHQLVSPFGKTDTASVLSEAIGYIRFLQAQIDALSSPYMGNVAGSMGHTHQQSDSQHRVKDLKSRGLCLVPISCTQHVASDNTVGDYWAPALGGGYL